MPKRFGTPGPRAIYPAACTSLSLAACDPLAQLLFDRMLTQADDQGRLLGDPKVVKALCMPLIPGATPKAVEKWLGQLEAQGMIRRYEAGGTPLIQFVNWWDHQGGMKKSYPSRFPGPTGWEDRIRGLTGDDAGANGGTAGGDVPPKPTENPPSARAPSAAAAAAAEPNPAAAAPQPPALLSQRDEDDDHLETWYRLTGSWPSQKSLPWLNELAADHGSSAVSEALAVEWQEDPTRSTVLGRVRDRLEREAHSAERRRQDAQRRAAEDERRRIEDMPPEQRAANMRRLREDLAKSGLLPPAASG